MQTCKGSELKLQALPRSFLRIAQSRLEPEKTEKRADYQVSSLESNESDKIHRQATAQEEDVQILKQYIIQRIDFGFGFFRFRWCCIGNSIVACKQSILQL